MLPLTQHLILAAILFGMGLIMVLIRRHTILVLAGIEMMLNAANLNFVAFWRYGHPGLVDTPTFAMVNMIIAGAEAAVGLAMVIATYRRFRTVNLEDIARLKG